MNIFVPIAIVRVLQQEWELLILCRITPAQWLRSRQIHQVGVQYRNIEDLCGNTFDCIDGCDCVSDNLVIILNPNNFGNNASGIVVGTPMVSIKIIYPSKFIVSNTAGFPIFYPTAGDGRWITYSCSSWDFQESNRGLSVEVLVIYHNLFSVKYGTGANDTSTRLMELPDPE